MSNRKILILYYWSRDCKLSYDTLDYLTRQGLVSNGPNSIVRAICLDNSIARNFVTNSADGIKATTVPCFSVTFEQNGVKETTIIDNINNMSELVENLVATKDV